MHTKKNLWRAVAPLLLLILVMALAACGAQVPQAAGCPEPASGNELLTNDPYGYCLVYPDSFVTEGTVESTLIDPAPGRQGQEPRQPFADITVEAAEGRTTTEVADAMVRELETIMPGMEFPRST